VSEQLFVPQVLYFNEFKNLEVINEVSQGWQNRWTYIKKGTTEAKLWVFTTPRMQFSCVDYNNAIMIDSSPPVGSIHLSFIRTHGLCNTNYQKMYKHELVVVESGEETNFFANQRNEIFSIVFEKSFFNMLFYQYFGENFKKIRLNSRFFLKEDRVDNFIQKLNYWFYFVKKQDTQLTNENFFSIEEDILDNLFSLIVTSKDSFKKEKEYTKKARKLLQENINNIYTIADLTKEFDISTRTLQYNFKQQLGVTPKQYLQNLRLNAIRQQLLSKESHKRSIADIISEYGFFHPSHFAQEYKTFFGETPTTTLNKLKT